MSFIHSREFFHQGDVVVVDCSHQSNIMLTDDHHFQKYRRGGGGFEYYGGHYKTFPVRIPVPRTGHWNVTIDLGGGSANIRYSINVVKG
ncbi:MULTISPECIES: DUF1883 domain-containing protein [Aeromonas]|jgi:hypothetical protein|uniref:DUF1883 domain-containing protein n=1 Tax=Aeromonas TaxID=642 RepID=UPI0022472E83|nr:DUF1883 domain-containing protein [Aeromonas veronii]MCX0424838.1 DUF1883 domain-containing protein [Aeromonas veronii]